MKVCVIHPPTGIIGGDKTVSYQIIKALDELGHEIVYYTEDSEEDMVERISYEPSENVHFKQIRNPILSRLLDRLNIATLLQKGIENRKISKLASKKSEDFDLIFLTSKLLESGESFSCRTLQYIHGPPPDLEKRSRGLYDKIVFTLFSPELAYTDTTIFNSQFTARQWHMEDRGEIIYPYPSGDFKNKKWGDREDKAVIVARISPDKNLKDAIEIAERSDLRLDIVGLLEDERYLEELRDISGDDVNIFPNAKREDLTDKLANAKIGLNCREKEPFGIAVTEYLKSGMIPLVRSNSGAEEIVKYDEFIYRDVEDAVVKVEKVLNNKDNLENRLRSRSDKFSSEIFGKNINNILRDVEKRN